MNISQIFCVFFNSGLHFIKYAAVKYLNILKYSLDRKVKSKSSYVGFSLVMRTLTLLRAFLAPVGAGAAAGAGLVWAGLAWGLAI